MQSFSYLLTLMFIFLTIITASADVTWNSYKIEIDDEDTFNVKNIVFPNNSDNGHLLLENGYLYSTTNGGETWSASGSAFKVTLPGSTNEHDVIPVTIDHPSGNRMYAAGIVEGTNHMAVGVKQGNNDFNALMTWPGADINPILAMRSGTAGKIMLSADEAHELSVVDLTNSTADSISWFSDRVRQVAFRDVYFQNVNRGYAVGMKIVDGNSVPVIWDTYDGGRNWTATQLNVDDRPNVIQFYNNSIGYIGGDNGLLLKTTNGGEHWGDISASLNHDIDIRDMDFRTADYGVIGGKHENSTTLFITENGGQSWQAELNHFAGQFYSVHINESGIVYAGNHQQRIYQSSKTFTRLDIPNPANISIFPNPTTGEVTIDFGTLYDEAPTWIRVYNSNGEKVLQEQTIAHEQHIVDLSGNPEGIYFFKLTSPYFEITENIILVE